jgi:serine phosphatase RsbU (regulator of sigma subunit)
VFGRKKNRGDTPSKPASGAALVDLQQQNERLQRAVEQLSLLNDLSQAIGVSDSSESMIEAIVRRAKRSLAAEQVMIYFVDQTGDEDVFRTRVRDATVHRRQAFHFDDALRGMMEFHRAPFLSNDPQHESRLQGVELDPGLRSLLCVPLLVRGKLTGLVAACNKQGEGGFDEDDQRLLAIMANQSAQILETTRLREEEAALARLNEDVAMARDIQMRLLPEAPPEIAGYDIVGHSVPAEMVGGDYFDYFALPDDRVGICLADVSGKGVPASLLMANLQATLRGQAVGQTNAADCVRWCNRLLYRSTADDKFATLVYFVLDPRTHTLTYCNAGHERPLHRRSDGSGCVVEELPGGGLVLGILDDFEYVEGEMSMEPGDLVLLYSDGLTDAVDAADRAFPMATVREILERSCSASSAQVVENLLEAVKRHAAGVPAFDDVTLVAIRRTG